MFNLHALVVVVKQNHEKKNQMSELVRTAESGHQSNPWFCCFYFFNDLVFLEILYIVIYFSPKLFGKPFRFSDEWLLCCVRCVSLGPRLYFGSPLFWHWLAPSIFLPSFRSPLRGVVHSNESTCTISQPRGL